MEERKSGPTPRAPLCLKQAVPSQLQEKIDGAGAGGAASDDGVKRGAEAQIMKKAA